MSLFPPMPQSQPPESYINVPTTNPQEVVDRARWGITQNGVQHVSAADLFWHWSTIVNYNPDVESIVKTALASFKDPMVFFILYMNNRFSLLDAFSMSISLGNNAPALAQTLAEFVASEPAPISGGPSGK